MATSDAILDMANAELTIRRRARGAFGESGRWVPGPATTFTIQAYVQPATGMQRVIGGRDMRADEQGQHVDDVRAVYTAVELRTRDANTEPDMVIGYKGADWIAVRQEEWESPFDEDDVYFRVLITRETRGAA